ncbi:MAG: DUF2207 domain-containing protein [Candidatus Aminicenantes bacterium]|nr:DUF2207 domain-containing protein [Candidatus Aminicenantes bacterium]
MVSNHKFFPGRKGLVIFFLGILIFYSYLRAEKKNYYFPQLKADYYVQKDGSVRVDEYLTFEFRGRFSWASLWVPLTARRTQPVLKVQVTDFRVADEQDNELQVETVVEKNRFRARWRFQAANERRTFHLRYKVNGAILDYEDVSELYWQVIGEEVDRPTASVLINVHLPEPLKTADQVLIYGHGPLSAQSKIIDLQTFRFEAKDVPAHQFVEIRVVWPKGLVRGVPAEGYNRKKIEQEEAEYVQQTIRRIKQAKEGEEKTQLITLKLVIGWFIWQIVGPLIWLIFYLVFWGKYGRDYKFEDLPDYYREIPSALPPALVQVLRREGKKVTPVALTATIFDLARRGYLEIKDEQTIKKTLLGEKIKTETFFSLKKEYFSDKNLEDFEKDVLELLFETIRPREEQTLPRVGLKDFVEYLNNHPVEFQTWFRKWAEKIDRQAKTKQFLETKSLKVYKIFMVVTIPLAVITFSPLLLFMALLLGPTLKRRKKEWAKENELWKALQRFLRDFSDFEQVPPEAYKLWDKYLVFGVLFGQTKKILKMLPRILPEDKTGNTGWIYGLVLISSGGHYQVDSLNQVISSIENVARTISSASTSAAHYSSGGGGGFSGGGGGGGGGGGVSAG